MSASSARRLRRPLVTAALAALALLASAAPASAATTCDGTPTSRPFIPWLDYFNYALVPRGDFESDLTGWTVAGGAKIGPGNEPWRVAGSDDSSSLVLPAGASAASPSFCGGLGYPTIRMFSKATGGLVPLLRVDIIYTDLAGVLRSHALGTVTPTATWQPSLPLVTLSGLPLLTGSRLAVRLTAVGGAVAVDDVYVDPYSRN